MRSFGPRFPEGSQVSLDCKIVMVPFGQDRRLGVALLEGREDACPGDGFLIAESATQSCMVRP